MGNTGTKGVSLLTGDWLFLVVAIVATIAYVSCSSFMSSNTVLKDGIDASRQVVSKMRDSVTLDSLPGQPDRMVLLLLSIVASNSDVSQAVSDAIIGCFSNASETDRKYWGAYRLQRFTETLVQVEYFVLTSEQESLVVPEKIDGFIRMGNLTECVRASNVDFPEKGLLFGGRTIIAPETGNIVSSEGDIPGWAIGVVILGVVFIGGIALIVLWCKGERVYKEEDYEKYEDDESIEDGVSENEGGDILRAGNSRIDETVAGQHRRGIVSRI